MTRIAVNHKPRRPLATLMDLLLPQPCRLCGGASGGAACCAPCAADLPWSGPDCLTCGLPLHATAGRRCGACLWNPPAFTMTTVAFGYQWPVDRLIKSLKYRGRLADSALLGALLAERLVQAGAPRPECLIPVPLHPRKLRQRGFNQAGELANALGRHLGIPVETGLLQRRRFTESQAGLSAAARRRNLRGAFECVRVPELTRAALVDDVITTGSTVRAAAVCLRRAGVRRVDVWAVARAR